MKLQDCIIKNYNITKSIKLYNKIQIRQTIEFPSYIIDLFDVVIYECDKLLKKDKIPYEYLHNVLVIFTKDLSFSATNTNKIHNGMTTSIILYAVQTWADKRYKIQQVVRIMEHELCHHFWNLNEECVGIKEDELDSYVRANQKYINIINVLEEDRNDIKRWI